MEAATTRADDRGTQRGGGRAFARRLSTETKQAFKTTEFWAFVAVAVAILISAATIKGGDTAPGTDEFIAREAWLYVAILTGAYVVGRGLAKSGSREPYTDSEDDRDRS
jgi:hypothetical protein